MLGWVWVIYGIEEDFVGYVEVVMWQVQVGDYVFYYLFGLFVCIVFGVVEEVDFVVLGGCDQVVGFVVGDLIFESYLGFEGQGGEFQVGGVQVVVEYVIFLLQVCIWVGLMFVSVVGVGL